MKFIDISLPWPGSMHDSRVYDMSSLSGVIDQKLEGTDYTIIGDCGYPLRNRLMTPYRDNGHFTPVK